PARRPRSWMRARRRARGYGCWWMTERSSDLSWATNLSPEGCRDVVLCRLLPNGEEMSMKLSVVVPFYNELRTLPTVTDRLLKADFGAPRLATDLSLCEHE